MDIKLIELKVNKVGNKSTTPFVFKSLGGFKHGKRNVIVENPITKETTEVRLAYIIKAKIYNPFRKKERTPEKLIPLINKKGKSSNPKFKFVKFDAPDKRCNQKVIVENYLTKEQKSAYISTIKKGANPFKSGSHKFRGNNLKIYINKLGSTSNPTYKFVKLINKKSKNYKRFFIIQNLLTKEKKQVDTDIFNLYLKSNKNPFDIKLDLAELKEAQPKYEKLFKSLNLKYYKNYNLGKKIIDFVFECPFSSKKYGVEVKHDLKRAYSKKQINQYKKLCKLKQYSFEKIILSSPKGKFGISLKTLKKAIISNSLKSLN
jgi:hypothetical protein